MKRIFTLLLSALLFFHHGNTQVVINELYTDPGAGKHEFIEFYNTATVSTPGSMDSITLVTFFDISGQKGFYVMDLPNMMIPSRSYFVAAAALPFNYQSISGSTAADFSWNSASFPTNNGYIKKWVQGGLNIFDGNLFYDEVALPANFNDFFFRRSGAGASYTVFLYKNGQLLNTFIGGTGGNATVVNEIINMPNLFVNMTGAAPDFTINFSGYASLPLEYCTQDAGSDNGYIREFDGACASWKKSSSSVTHTPRASNGVLIGISHGSVSVAAAISQGSELFGSMLNNDIVSAPSDYFPIDLQIYTDRGSTAGSLDPTDVFVKTNTETAVAQGPFHTIFFPWDAHILIAVKTSAGCFDKIIFMPNTIILDVQLISFTGTQTKNGIQLNWAVESNELADRFELQKSVDGKNYTTIALVVATDTAGRQAYTYNVPSPENEKVTYRLRIFNRNGKVDYSNNIAFQNNEIIKGTLTLLNNPVNDKLTLRYETTSSQAVKIRIMDMSGRIMQEKTLTSSKGLNTASFPLTAHLHRGMYLVTLFDGLTEQSAKFVKQ